MDRRQGREYSDDDERNRNRGSSGQRRMQGDYPSEGGRDDRRGYSSFGGQGDRDYGEQERSGNQGRWRNDPYGEGGDLARSGRYNLDDDDQRNQGWPETSGPDAPYSPSRYMGDHGERRRYRRNDDWGHSSRGGYGDERGFEGQGRNYGGSSFGSGYGQAGRSSGSMGGQEADQQRQDNRGRGPKNYQRSDGRIEEDVNDRLTDDERVDASDVTVKVKECEVTLNGTVPDRMAKRCAEDCAESVSGVSHVQNNLRVKKSGSEASQDQGKGS